MISDISGIICDGASNSCAMKVSTSASSAIKSVLIALNNRGATENDGIVTASLDESISNLCRLASGAMKKTDKQIIRTLSSKSKKIVHEERFYIS